MTTASELRAFPGPTTDGDLPEPTEIVCIETDKVYDFCFQQEQRSIERQDVQFPSIDFSRDFEVICEIVRFDCTEVDRRPVQGDGDGLQQVTLRQQVKVKLTIEQERDGDNGEDGEDGNVVHPPLVDEAFEAAMVSGVRRVSRKLSTSLTKTVILCAPAGTEIDCESLTSVECECVVTPAGTSCADVACDVIICKIVQVTALVKLLVPSLGFCVPVPCVEAPDVFPCPPEVLFPPQCLPPGHTMDESVSDTWEEPAALT